MHKDPRPALRSYGPSLGMKKSSSLESLQAAVHDLARSEDVLDPGANYTRPQVKVVRGRGCNESFRAAVDRSYEAAIEAGVVLGPLSEEEQEAMRLRSDSVSGSLRSVPSVQAHAAERPHAVDDKRKKKKEKEKRKSLLRGLGSMFRVGRHKKDEEEAGNHAPNDVLADEAERQRQENLRCVPHPGRSDIGGRVTSHAGCVVCAAEPLPGVGGVEHGDVIPQLADEHETDGKAVGREASVDGDRRMSGDVEYGYVL
ncbi:PREDICTED: partitioning defective 3 homolog isoform X2 [Priapulus caudatus]|uniref:Partitioning defective 3 homolog isoform X2 n=1 Tax=Priapulus caudatus TaxID=37621 RepID=A0ABM1EN13_PRICU|nr:PREDICTED: partitioning defective 3 homolog isoform X2 [Priapulus caudatus]